MDEETLDLIAKAEICASALEFCSTRGQYIQCPGCPAFELETRSCQNDIESANVIRGLTRRLTEAFDNGEIKIR